jgi:cellulose synthase/poly-beta-1,6-N-acetylglucosamine synthase-like glycosyltransferase
LGSFDVSAVSGEPVELVISVTWLAVVAWLIARAFNQRGLLKPLPSPPEPPARPAGVAIIVPARDEQANIARCLTSFARQTYPAERLRVLVVDDHSADATVATAGLRDWVADARTVTRLVGAAFGAVSGFS